MRLAASAVLAALAVVSSDARPTTGTVPPGTYWQDPLCPQFDWCVEWVRIDTDGSVELGTSWQGQHLDKGSDADNRQIDLLDGRGRRSDHVAVSGAAAYGFVERSMGTRKVHGSFLFPKPAAGPAGLTLRDDARGRVISGMSFDPARRSTPDVTRAFLGDVATADRIEIDEQWEGLGPSRHRRIVLSRRGPAFVGEVRGIPAERGWAAQPEPLRQLRLQASGLERALLTLSASALDTDRYRPYHVLDSAPRMTMTVSAGGRSFVFTSTSSADGHVPWECTIGTRRFVAPSYHPGVAFEAVRALVDGKPEPTAPDERLVDRGDLRLAAQLGDAARVRALLAKGAQTGSRTGFDGETPLTAAARWGQAAAVEALLAGGADPGVANAHGETALAIAAEKGHASIVKRLAALGPDPADVSLVVKAAEGGSIESVRTLLAGRKLGAEAAGALAAAAARNSVEMIALLLNAGVPVDAPTPYGGTPLAAAINHGHLEAVEALLAAGASLQPRPPDGPTPLHAAARMGHADVVEALLRAGADPSAVAPPLRSTPLFGIHAPGVVAPLVKAGAQVDARREDGATPLVALPTAHFGWSSYGEAFPRRPPPPVSRAAAARALLDAGADVNAVDAKGVSAFQAATTSPITEDKVAMALLLIERGAALDRRDPNARTVLRETAEYFAEHEGSDGARWVEPLIRALAKAGAPDPPDANGRRAIDMARRRGSARLVALLSGDGPAGAVPLGLSAGEREALLGSIRRAEWIELSIEWYQPDRRREATVLMRSGEAFTGEWSEVRPGQRAEGPNLPRHVSVEAKDVEPLLAMLTESTLVDRAYDPKSVPGQIFNVNIVVRAGTDRLTFGSSSHAPDFVPWQLWSGERRFVVPTSQPGRVYAALRALVTGEPTRPGAR